LNAQQTDEKTNASPIVNTVDGRVQGVTDGDVDSFKGIPFAAPPVGALRLKRSVPHPPWPETLDCTGYRACALQSVAPGLPAELIYPGGLDESCLHLNVWTPPGSPENCPVYVWMHGGAFMVGSGSEPTYEGLRFAERGVVVVTINYRLGAFGFMWPDDGDANCGLWDQVRALEWVRENIEAFGGDRGNVTIGGESAGAGCATCLVASPIANRLFHRAVIMSTVAHTTDDERTAKLRATQYARSLGAESIRAGDFQSFDAQDMLAAQAGGLDRAPEQAFVMGHNTPGWQGPELDHLNPAFEPAEPDGIHYTISGGRKTNGLPLGHGFFPVVDGELLPRHPLDLIDSGTASHIDILVGSNREETAFRENPEDPHVTAPMTFGARVDSIEDAVDRAHWFFMGWGRLGEIGGARRNAEELVHAYADAEGGSSGAAPEGTVQHAWNRLASDMAFNASTVMVASRQARHSQKRGARTFAYRFDGFGNRNAFHGWELGLIFGTLVNENNPATVEFADTMRSAFAAFIETGDPGWPAWSEADGLNGPVMRFDRNGSRTDSYLEAAPEIGRIVDLLDVAFFHTSNTT